MKNEMRRVKQVHAGLLGDLRRVRIGHAEGGAERAERAVMPDATIEIDDEHGRAKARGLAQNAHARAGAEILGDQLPQALVFRQRRHQAASSSGVEAPSPASASANSASAARPGSVSP